MTASIFEGAAFAAGRSRALNPTEWEAGSEVDALAQLLHPGENVEHLARGRVIESAKPAVRSWLIAVTSLRLVCIKGTRITSRRAIDIPYATIQSATVATGLLGTELRVRTGQGTVRIRLPRQHAHHLHGVIDAHRANRPTVETAQLPSSAEVPRMEYLEDTVERLESEVERLRRQVDFLENLIHGPHPTPPESLP